MFAVITTHGMIKENDLLVLCHLRKDGRKNVTNIARETGIPPTTIYDKLKSKNRPMKRFTAMLDFPKIGAGVRSFLIIKAIESKKYKLENYLFKHENVNNVFRTNNGSDYIIETVFGSKKDAQNFNFDLKTEFGVVDLKEHGITHDLIREKFLTKKEHIQLLRPDNKAGII